MKVCPGYSLPLLLAGATRLGQIITSNFSLLSFDEKIKLELEARDGSRDSDSRGIACLAGAPLS